MSRNTLSKISRSYKQLSDFQMKGWETLAGKMNGICAFDKLAELIPLSIKMLQIWNIHLNMSTQRIRKSSADIDVERQSPYGKSGRGLDGDLPHIQGTV